MAGRIREIDGLRAGAVLAVMLFHYRPVWLPGGFVGVDLFFVISGYVITRGLHEDLSTGQLSLSDFYRRRFFRIVPPLAVMVAAVLLIFGRQYLVAACAALVSMMNWYRAFTPDAAGYLGHAWSLSAEEQFYLLWPLGLVFLFSRGRVREGLVATLACLTLWRIGLTLGGASGTRLYNGLDTHADGLLLGCLLAVSPLTLSGRWWPLPAGILAIASLIQWKAWWLDLVGLSIISFSSGALLLCAVNPPPLLKRLLTLALVQWIGLRSYSIYLWHYPIWGFLSAAGFVQGKLLLAATCILTLAAGGLSYRFIEQPFQRRRQVACATS